MIDVEVWTGREALRLRTALRMSQREFAAHLGVSERTIAKWDSRGADTKPRGEFQRMLDTALAHAPAEAQERFRAQQGDHSSDAPHRPSPRARTAPQLLPTAEVDVFVGSPADTVRTDRAAMESFRTADSQVGGGVLYASVLNYLRSQVGPRLLGLGDSGWMFDLVSRYPRRRDAAWARHVRSRADLDRALQAVNALWWQAGKTSNPADPVLAVSMRRARAAHASAVANTLHGVIGEFLAVRWAGDLDDYRRLAPYAVLFLEWEAQFPQQWRSAGPWSPWGLKKRVLRQFADMGVPEPQVDAVTRLALAAVNRGQQCEDLGYVLVARSLDGPVLRARIEAAVCSPDPTVQRRAGYMRWAMDDAQAPVTLASWRAWCAGAPLPPPDSAG